MLKVNRTECSQTIIDECIFRVFHNQNKWDVGSFTTQSQEDMVQRFMKYGIFNNFRSDILHPKNQKALWEYIKKNNLGYGDVMSILREMFYDYQEGMEWIEKNIL